MKKIILLAILIFTLTTSFGQSFQTINASWNAVSADENPAISEVKIYPNPCKGDVVTVEFNNREIKEIRLTNITGKEIFFKSYQLLENKKQIQVNNIPNGIYVIKIKTSEDKYVFKKLMISKS